VDKEDLGHHPVVQHYALNYAVSSRNPEAGRPPAVQAWSGFLFTERCGLRDGDPKRAELREQFNQRVENHEKIAKEQGFRILTIV
jgi:hypothetical protein